MSHISAAHYEEYHESRESLRADEDTRLYCNACGKKFEPTEPTMQKDEWCLCRTCADAITEMCAGRIA